MKLYLFAIFDLACYFTNCGMGRWHMNVPAFGTGKMVCVRCGRAA